MKNMCNYNKTKNPQRPMSLFHCSKVINRCKKESSFLMVRQGIASQVFMCGQNQLIDMVEESKQGIKKKKINKKTD